jgi:hypothetical protein
LRKEREVLGVSGDLALICGGSLRLHIMRVNSASTRAHSPPPHFALKE